MADTNLSESVSIPALGSIGGHGDSSPTTTEYPVGTMIQKNGVDVSDDFNTLVLPGDIQEDPNGTLKYTGAVIQQNGVSLSSSELSAIDFITNNDVTESPSTAIEVSDTSIKKDGTLVKNSPKKINFVGDMLVTESATGEIAVNVAADGFFGDGVDGDYTLDDVQASVAGLFTKGAGQSAKSISKIVPIQTTSEFNDVAGTYSIARQSEVISLVLTEYYVVINITMDTPFDGADESETAVLSCTYLDPNGVETTESISLDITRQISGTQIECQSVISGVPILTPISPYRTETVYSLTVNGKTSTAAGTLLRASKSYIEIDSPVFTSDNATGSILQTVVGATTYNFTIISYGSPLLVFAVLAATDGSETQIPFTDFTLIQNNITKNYIGQYTGKEGVGKYDYANFVLDDIGQVVTSSAVVVFSENHGFISDDIIKISGATGITGINGVWRIISLGYNEVVLIGYQFSGGETLGSSGLAIKLVDYTLLRDAFFDNLTIADNARLCTNNYRLFAKGNLTVEGCVSNNGDAAGTDGYFPAMGNGGAGGRGGITTIPSAEPGFPGVAGAAQTNSIFNASDEPNNGKGALGGFGLGAFSGAAQAGGDGGGGALSGSSTKITDPYQQRFNLAIGACLAASLFKLKAHASSGGGGGGGRGGFYSVSYVGGVGGAGGDGGKNAGYLLICAGSILGSGKIASFGQAGNYGGDGAIGQKAGKTEASGSGGGGGGGGGGAGGIMVLMTRFIDSTITTDITGGIGGEGGYLLHFDPLAILRLSSGNTGRVGRTGQLFELLIT